MRGGRRQDATAAGVLLLTLLAIPLLPPLRVQASWTALVHQDDPLRRAQERFRETFGAGEGLALVLRGEPPAPVREARRLQEVLVGWPEIGAVLGPRAEVEVPGTVGPQGRSAVLYLELVPGAAADGAGTDLVGRLGDLAVAPGVRLDVAGNLAEEVALADALARDQRRLVPLVFVVLVLLGALLLRTRECLVGLALVLASTLLLTLASYGLLYGRLTTVTSLLTPIVLTVAAANALHFMARFREERRRAGPEDALRTTRRRGGRACLLATATTGAGFLSLLAIGIPSFHRLALAGALGCGWTYVSVMGLLPAVLRRGARSSEPPRLPFRGLVHRAETDLLRRGPLGVVVVFVLLALAGGVHRLRAETGILTQLPSSSSLPEVVEILDRDLSGSVLVEVFWTSPEGFRSADGLARLEAAEARIRRALPEVRGVTGAAPAVALAAEALPGADPLALLGALESGALGPLPRWLDEEGRAARLTVRLPTGTSRDVMAWAEQIERALRRDLPEGERVRVVGAALLISRALQDIVHGQGLACLLSIAVVSLLAGLVLRSWRALPVILVANVTPLAAMAGLLGWLGEPISVSTALVGSVVFGLVVDDTLHFLAALDEQGDGPKGPGRALARLGTAFVATSLLLLAGALTASTGRAGPVGIFGRLMAAGVLMALLCDLFVAPRVAARLRRRPPPRRNA